MQKSEKSFRSHKFSHIYVEEEALLYPVAERVIKRFSSARVVTIQNYKRFFNRPKQHFQLQKKSPKLILAVKKAPFIYDASEYCQSFGNENAYYSTPVLNCLFNCDYCFLQGMYNSANIVIFVNHTDFLNAATRTAKVRPKPDQPLFISVSYETDLMMFEKFLGYCGEWIDLAKENPDLLLELRTKSAAYDTIECRDPSKRTILAWSLAPQSVIDRFERSTPSLNRRLESISKAAADGWPIRLVFDPVIPLGEWQTEYAALVTQIFKQIPRQRIRDAAVGLFRMGETHRQRLRKQRWDCDLFDQMRGDSHREMERVLFTALAEYLDEEKIAVWEPALPRS